jgi:putative restriction endonuclease
MPIQHWSREQLLVAFALYCRIPFGKFHQHNPEIIHIAKQISRTPSALAMKLSNIASIDPEFMATGRHGLSGASAGDRKMWKEMQNDWSGFVAEAEKALNALGESFATEPETSDSDFSAKDKVVPSKVRIGQQFFRKAVLSAYENRCCITGLAFPALVVASHIKPWSQDESNRLNPRNGLALSALHDKAFDIGIITIDPDLRILVTRKIGNDGDKYFASSLMAFEGKKVSDAGKFRPDPTFLEYHRNNIFEKSSIFADA